MGFDMQAAELVEEYISAWNRCDPAAIVGLMTNDGVYFDVPTNEKLSGEMLVQYLANDFSRRKLHYDLVGEILIGDSTIAFQYRTCNADDPLDDAARLQGAEFLTTSGGKVTGIEDYYKIPSEPESRNRADTAVTAGATGKYRKSGMRPERQQVYMQRLTRLMETERLYLEASLTLPELARRVSCSINHLSQVINDGLQMSFYEFLNQYRVDAAKQMLIDAPSSNYTVGEIAKLAGFNSTSAFYLAFRRLCKKTPAEYRRQSRGN
jgi:AraC-like DNA-binding protein/ketosteroid isomerase-like protein